MGARCESAPTRPGARQGAFIGITSWDRVLEITSCARCCTSRRAHPPARIAGIWRDENAAVVAALAPWACLIGHIALRELTSASTLAYCDLYCARQIRHQPDGLISRRRKDNGSAIPDAAIIAALLALGDC